MSRLPAAAVLLLCLAPLRAEEAALPDALRQGIAEARAAYERAHGMPPSLERNEALSEVKRLVKAVQGKHALLKEVLPEEAKAFAADMTDLQGMLFWINKSMVVVIPPSLPTPVAPPPPPPRKEVPEPEPDAAEPAPAPPAPPPPSPSLGAEDHKRVLAVLGELSGILGKIESCRDDIADAERRQKDLFGLLEGIQAELKAKGSNWNFVKACESRRASLLESLHRSRKGVQSRRGEIRTQEDRILDCRSLLERHGDLLLPVLAEWLSANPAERLPEGMVRYANGRLSGSLPSCFTPAPPSAPEGSGQGAEKISRLLGEYATRADKRLDLEGAVATGEAEAALLTKELEDLNTHWSWRTSNTAWGVSEAKRVEGDKAQLQAAIDKLRKEIARDREALEKALKQEDVLRGKLEATPADDARAVEAWRRAARHVPAPLVEALEAWARRVSG